MSPGNINPVTKEFTMRYVGVILLTALLVLPIAGLTQDTAEPAAESAPQSAEDPLARLEQKVDLLTSRLGSVSGRATIADFQDRRFNDLERKLDILLRSVSDVNSELRKSSSRR
jgi:hypothetical protein